jgi:hypothetical protein
MAPKPPQRSDRPGQAGTALDTPAGSGYAAGSAAGGALRSRGRRRARKAQMQGGDEAATEADS